MNRKSVLALVAATVFSLPGAAQAQQASPAPQAGAMPAPNLVAPPAEPDAIALRAPVPGAAAEQWEQYGPSRWVRNVVTPTLTPVLPEPGKETGVAVIIAPGGAFRFLALDTEGFAVARWLAAQGIAAFVLKYRTVPTPRDRGEFLKGLNQFMSGVPAKAPPTTAPSRPLPATAEAVEDGLAALQLVRARAGQWKIDPAKIGFIGFSAGAMTALGVGLTPDASARPAFIGPIYGPMGPREVPKDAPPMFAAIALDDPLFARGNAAALVQSWRDAGRPVEAHFYERGGHGFGMNGASEATRLWSAEFHAWLKDRGLLPATK